MVVTMDVLNALCSEALVALQGKLQVPRKKARSEASRVVFCKVQIGPA